MIDTHAWGPLWWAINWDPPGRRVYLAWFKEVEEPYRAGQGIGIRRHDYSIEFGLCRPTKRASALEQPSIEELRFWNQSEEDIQAWQEEFDRQYAALHSHEADDDWAET